MGAGESTARGGGDAEGVVDYYKILEVAEDATGDEIKVSKRSNTKQGILWANAKG